MNSDGDGASDLEGAAEVGAENKKEAKPMAPTAGLRTGKQDKISTILTALVTKEPYSSHAQADPVSASEQEPSQDETVDEKLPPASSEEGQAKPDDVQTEEGTNKGANYVDKAGNAIGGVSDAVGTATEVTPSIPPWSLPICNQPQWLCSVSVDTAINSTPFAANSSLRAWKACNSVGHTKVKSFG